MKKAGTPGEGAMHVWQRSAVEMQKYQSIATEGWVNRTTTFVWSS